MNRMNETFMSATAVTRLSNGDIVVAAKDGVYVRSGEVWIRSLTSLGKRIRDLTSQQEKVFGIGDGGTFIKSTDGGRSWTARRFSTQAPGWSICSDATGTVVAHGEKVLYISTDYGDTWSVVKPFQRHDSPSIRSLCLYQNFIFIGTKIHSSQGGVWCYDLNDGTAERIKAEDQRMISSMLTYKQFLITASGGSCSSFNGSIDFCKMAGGVKGSLEWETCHGQQQSFLDVNEDGGNIYATSTQNKEGYGTVSKVCLDAKEVLPCNLVKGHGWRISGKANNYFVAGLYESIRYSSTALA
ncbi:hypothetical protein MO973_12900 [Paenibacillus sp. TRM 82003]|nr:hypothetical protein [Paenibacillus sp. TRM 82003]